MTNNTQLPAEVVHKIWFQAEEYAEEKVKAINEEHFNVYNAYIAGATEYASKLQFAKEEREILLEEMTNLSSLLQEKDGKLQEAQQEIESLTNQLKGHANVSNENMKLLRQENEKGRTLLEKFISRHEAGLLPDRLLYNEIKDYLDGTK